MVRSRGRTSTSLGVAAGVIGAIVAAGGPSVADASPAGWITAAAPARAGSGGVVAAPDLECFVTRGAPLHLELHLSQLDPAVMQLGVPDHSVVVRELVETCVAARRRGIPDPARPEVPVADLACYRIDAAPLPGPVALAVQHADPALALLPGHDATLIRPVELCLPVARDGAAPPPDVRRLVQFIALECYAVEPGPHPAFELGLSPLDPRTGVADHALALGADHRQVCVPVAKNSERIPGDVLGVVRSIGVEKLAAARPAAVPATRAVLRQLNPLLATLPAVPVVLERAGGLMVPVSRRAAPSP
jgi:hypothetical protein